MSSDITSLVELTGVADRTLRDWRAKKIIPSADASIEECNRAIIAYLQTKNDSPAELRGEYYRSRIDLNRAKQITIEMENDKAAGDLVEAEEVAKAWAKMVTQIRALLLAMPGRIAIEIFGAAEITDVELILVSAIDQILNELSNGIPRSD